MKQRRMIAFLMVIFLYMVNCMAGEKNVDSLPNPKTRAALKSMSPTVRARSPQILRRSNENLKHSPENWRSTSDDRAYASFPHSNRITITSDLEKSRNFHESFFD